MGVKNLPHICSNLIAQGMEKDTPAAVIRWGTRTSQEVLAGTVEELSVRKDKPSTRLATRVVREDGAVALEGGALCYTMTLP